MTKPNMDFSEEIQKNFVKSRLGITLICRTCLSVCDNVNAISLFESNLNEQISAFIGVKVESNDGYPPVICSNCCEEFRAAHTFFTRCRQSDLLLRAHYIKSELNLEDEHSRDNFDFMDTNSTESTPELAKVELKLEINVDNKIEHPPEDRKTNIIKRASNNFQCKLCGKLLSSKASLKNHTERFHTVNENECFTLIGSGRKRYQCKQCDYSSDRRQTLEYHFRIHTGEKPYKCELCGKCYTQPSSLLSHKKTHSDKIYFTCGHCGKEFKHKTKYKLHLRVHDNAMLFVCNLCNKALKYKNALVAHMKRHYNIKNFSCEICGARFVTHSELCNHSKRHSTIKKLICDMCGYKTYTKYILTIHMKRHYNLKCFKCDHCEACYYTKRQLQSHMIIHSGKKCYSCLVCEMNFKHSSSLNKHMLNAHGVKNNRSYVSNKR